MSENNMSVNMVAAATATGMALVTIGMAFQVASVVSTVATIGYSLIMLLSAAVSIASITAWIDQTSTDVNQYFIKMGEHVKFAVAGVFQYVAQMFVAAVVEGVANSIKDKFYKKIQGT